MREHSAQNSREWFEKAVRVYVEGHQACAWCGERYQVYKGHRSTRLEYYCPGCEFYVCHDLVTGQYYVAPESRPVWRSSSRLLQYLGPPRPDLVLRLGGTTPRLPFPLSLSSRVCGR